MSGFLHVCWGSKPSPVFVTQRSCPLSYLPWPGCIVCPTIATISCQTAFPCSYSYPSLICLSLKTNPLHWPTLGEQSWNHTRPLVLIINNRLQKPVCKTLVNPSSCDLQDSFRTLSTPGSERWGQNKQRQARGRSCC